jgi:hypothetical protein
MLRGLWTVFAFLILSTEILATETVSTPTANPPAGTYADVVAVTLSTSTPDAIVRFTVNGTTPTSSSPVYTAPITVGKTNTTIIARAWRSGFATSASRTSSYTLKCAAPEFSPPAGTYAAGQVVTLSTATPDALVRYTDDGADPTGTSAVADGPIVLPQNVTLKARTYRTGFASSAIVGAVYKIQTVPPVIEPAAGAYARYVFVTASHPAPGMALRYTVNGSLPTTSSPKIGEGFTLRQNAIVTVVGFHPDFAPTEPARADYVVEAPLGLPMPEITYVAWDASNADFFGAIPDDLGIITLKVSPAAKVIETDDETFHIRVNRSGLTKITLDCAFIDDLDRTGAHFVKTYQFTTNGETGNGSQLPPVSPTVTLTISGGLTGDKQATIDGQQYSLTNLGSVTATISASTSLGVIDSIVITGGNSDVTIPGTGASTLIVSQSVPAPEGRLSLIATAVASKGGKRASGSSKPVALIVDRTPPKLICRPAPKYWLDVSVPEALPPYNYEKTRPVYLNGNAESGGSGNKQMRKNQSALTFDRATFTVEAEVADETGVSPEKILVTQPSTVTFTVRGSATSQQTLVVGPFTSLPDGHYTLDTRLEDRCGNISFTRECAFQIDTTPPKENFGQFLPSREVGTCTTSPVRFCEIGAVVAVWQDSVGKANRCLPLSDGWGWALAREKPLPFWDGRAWPPPTTAFSFINRDMAGNISKPMAVTAYWQYGMLAAYSGLIGVVNRDADKSAYPEPTMLGGTYGVGQSILGKRLPMLQPAGIRVITPASQFGYLMQSVSRPVTNRFFKAGLQFTESVPPFDPGPDSDSRRISPAVLSMPPSWQSGPSLIDLRIRDAGIRQVRAGMFSTGKIWLNGQETTTYAGGGNDDMTGSVPIARDSASLRPGMNRLIYTAFGGYQYADYQNNFPTRWTNIVRVDPDVARAGSRATIGIEANFIDEGFAPEDFDAAGDYARFIDASSQADVTLRVGQGSGDAEARGPKIAILAQRLVVDGWEQRHRQKLELDIETGPALTGTLFHVDVKMGPVREYKDSLSQKSKGANGAHRMKESLTITKPDIRASVPAYAECLHKRSGTADEPVIVIESGGDKGVNGCSLVGFDDGKNNVWTFSARAAKPDPKEPAAYSVVWRHGGTLVSGSAGTGAGGGSASITVRYGAGRHIPKLMVYRTATVNGKVTGVPELVGMAEIHCIAVYSRSVDGTQWLTPAVTSDEYGSKGLLTSFDTIGNAKVQVAASPRGAVRSRMSADGYPQNEYWVTPADNADLPQPFSFKPSEKKNVWVQGYGEASEKLNDLSVRVLGSSQFSGDTTAAKYTAMLLDVAVDRNRDHKLDFSMDDRTGPATPYRFWLNDDRDEKVTSFDPIFGSVPEQDDVVLDGPDLLKNVIMNRRELEDFSPITVGLSRGSLATSHPYAILQARWRKDRQNGDPAIKLFRSADPNAGVGFLTDYEGISYSQTAEPFELQNQGADFKEYGKYAEVLKSISGTDWATIGKLDELTGIKSLLSERLVCPFIWDACSAGSGWLEFRVVAAGSPGIILGRDRAYLHLSPLLDWYTRVSTDSVGTDDFEAGRGTLPTELQFIHKQKPWVPAATEPHAIVFVHGYNMVPASKKHFAETAFKRMWWNGYQGRYVEFDWPTSFGITGSVGDPFGSGNGFPASQLSALHAGDKLKELIERMNVHPETYGTIHVMAHSHGNIVTANALKNLAPGTVDAYVGLQAAVASEWYGDPNLVMVTPRWLKGLAVTSNPPDQKLTIQTDYSGLFELIDGLLPVGEGLETPNMAQGFFTKNGQAIPGAKRRINVYNPNDWALGEYIWEMAGLFNPQTRMMQEGLPREDYRYLRQKNPPPSGLGPFLAPDYDADPGSRFVRYRWFDDEGGRNAEPITEIYSMTPLFWSDPVGILQGPSGPLPKGGHFEELAGKADGFGQPIMNRFVAGAPSTDPELHRQYEILSYIIEARMRAQGREILEASVFDTNVDAIQLWTNYADDSEDNHPNDQRNGTGINGNDRFSHHRWHSGAFNNTIMEQSNFWTGILIELNLSQKPLNSLPSEQLP